MKKSLCITTLIFLLMLAGCSSKIPGTSDVSSLPDKNAVSISFISSMGCNDRNCTDASHYHDCQTDCTDYDHYHNCALDCTEMSHHHSGQTGSGHHGEHHGDGHH